MLRAFIIGLVTVFAISCSPQAQDPMPMPLPLAKELCMPVGGLTEEDFAPYHWCMAEEGWYLTGLGWELR